jgi:hypothetical protein
MVGIYSKIKNVLDWTHNKAFKTVAPFIGKLGEAANSSAVRGIAALASPVLNGFMPGLGAGLNKGLDFLSYAGGIAKQAEDDYDAGMSLGDMGTKLMKGGYRSTPKKRTKINYNDKLKGLSNA